MSANSGTFSFLYFFLNQDPASNFLICDMFLSFTNPVPSVVLSTLLSCIAINLLSLVICKSTSI